MVANLVNEWKINHARETFAMCTSKPLLKRWRFCDTFEHHLDLFGVPILNADLMPLSNVASFPLFAF